MKHCTNCGGKLKVISRLEKKCIKCGVSQFESAKPVAMVMLLNKDRVCLIKQGYVSDKYVLIAGYNDIGESMEDTVRREVLEEVSCEIHSLSYFGSYFYKKKDLLMFCYVCTTGDEPQVDGVEVDCFEWFTLKDAVKKVREGSTAHRFIIEYLNEIKK